MSHRLQYLSHLGEDALRWLSSWAQSVSGWFAGAIWAYLPNPVSLQRALDRIAPEYSESPTLVD